MTGVGEGSDDDRLRRLGEDPEITDLGVRMRAELRAEAAEYEALAALDLARSRRLVDVLAEAAARGDEVELTLASTRLRGVVEDAVGDLVRLRTADEDVDVTVEAVRLLRVIGTVGASRSPASSERPRRTAASFRARLAEHEAAQLELGVVTDGPAGTLRGVIVAVAADHLVVRLPGDDRAYLALRDVEAVRRRRGRAR